jgi:hypothetical protein
MDMIIVIWRTTARIEDRACQHNPENGPEKKHAPGVLSFLAPAVKPGEAVI